MSLGQNAKITYKVHFFLTYSCKDTILEYFHVIFVILFYVHLRKIIILEKACPWDKNSHFSFPDIKMQHFTEKNVLFGFDHS